MFVYHMLKIRKNTPILKLICKYVLDNYLVLLTVLAELANVGLFFFPLPFDTTFYRDAVK